MTQTSSKTYSRSLYQARKNKTSDTPPVTPFTMPSLPIMGLVALLFYGFLALFILTPNFETHFIGDSISDLFMTNRHVWWIAHALQTGQDPFWQPLLVYPDGLSGAYIWATPFEYFPAWLFALFVPLTVASNLHVLVHITLNGWATYLLVQHLTQKHAPALVAGTLFAIAPAVQGRIYVGHALIVLWVLILGLYALYQLKVQWKWRWALLGVVCIGFSAGGSLTLLVFYIVPLLAWFLIGRVWSRQWGWFWRSIWVLVMGGVIMAGLLLPLLREVQTDPSATEQAGGGHVLYSADLLSIISPSPFHRDFSQIVDYPQRVLGANLPEGATYIGIVGGILVIIGLFTSFSARAWGRLAIIAWLFSLGPLLKIFDDPVVLRLGMYETYIPLPWALFEQLPLVSSTRAPARWGLLLALAVAVMSAYGMLAIWGWLQRRPPQIRRWRWGMVAIAMFVIIWEYPLFSSMPRISSELPQGLYDLAERDDVRAVFNVPYNDRVLVKHAQYMQVAHQHPILTGMFYRDTPANVAKLALLQATLDPALLHGAGADVVIVQKTADDTLYNRAIGQLGTPVYEDVGIAIFDVPTPADEPHFIALPIPTQTITYPADAYFFASQTGWSQLSLTVASSMPRKLTIHLNNNLVRYITVASQTTFRIPIPIENAGFHHIRLALDPPCPIPITYIQACVGIDLYAMQFGEVSAGTFDAPVVFASDIVLQGHELRLEGDRVWLDTSWYLANGLDDKTIRFVHITDSTGSLIAQNDGIMTVLSQPGYWLDSIWIDLPPDLPDGAYTVSLGWYHYPSFDRLAVLNPPSPHGVYTIGIIQIQKEDA